MQLELFPRESAPPTIEVPPALRGLRERLLSKDTAPVAHAGPPRRFGDLTRADLYGR
jgi:hypothetical protein